MKVYICYILSLIILHVNAVPVDLNKIKNLIVKKNGEIEKLIEQLIRLSDKNEEDPNSQTSEKLPIGNDQIVMQNNQNSAQIAIGNNQRVTQISNQITKTVNIVRNVNRS